MLTLRLNCPLDAARLAPPHDDLQAAICTEQKLARISVGDFNIEVPVPTANQARAYW